MTETTAQLLDRLNREVAGRLQKSGPVGRRPVTEGELRAAAQRAVDKFQGDLKTALGQDRQKTICVDFDGVIADYSKGWQGAATFGTPLPGAADALAGLRAAGWKVIIHTTRKGTLALRSYLHEHGIPYDEINRNSDQPPGSNEGKPIADVYLDDRAVRFQSWPQALAEIGRLHKSGGRVLLKAHVHSYTRRDGTTVQGYEAARKPKAPRRAASAAVGAGLSKPVWKMTRDEWDSHVGRRDPVDMVGEIMQAKFGDATAQQIADAYVKKYQMKKPIKMLDVTTDEWAAFVKKHPEWKTDAASGGGFQQTRAKDHLIVIIRPPGMSRSKHLGVIRHEIEHAIDRDRGYEPTIHSVERESVERGTMQKLGGIYIIRGKREPGKPTNVGDVIRRPNVGHHQHYAYFDLDYPRRSAVAAAHEAGEKVPAAILKELGIKRLRKSIAHPMLLIKAHIRSYIRNGVLVREHDDARHARKIGDLYDMAQRRDTREVKEHTIRTVSPEEAKRLKEKTGIDVTGYKFAVTNSGLRHVDDHHGDAEAEKGAKQIAITGEEAKQIPLVIGKPSMVERAKDTKAGYRTIAFEKRFKDGTLRCIFEVLPGIRVLNLKTMYKRQD